LPDSPLRTASRIGGSGRATRARRKQSLSTAKRKSLAIGRKPQEGLRLFCFHPLAWKGGQMKRLNQCRARIDSIDAEILRLLSRRARIAIQVGQLKRSSGLPYYSPERERDILTRLMQMNP
jgi:hypothetical protein